MARLYPTSGAGRKSTLDPLAARAPTRHDGDVRHVVALAALAVACGSPTPDRVKLGVRLGDATVLGHAVTWEVAVADVRALRLRPCPEDDVVLAWPGPAPVEALTVPARTLPQPWTVGFDDPQSVIGGRRARLPVGPWCGLDVVMRGTLTLVGDVEGAGRIELEVPLDDLGADGLEPFGGVELVTREIDGVARTRAVVRNLVVELGAEGWLDALPSLPAVGATLVVPVGDPVAEAVGAALAADARLVRDLDDDGQAGPVELTDAVVGALAPL